MLVGHSIDKTRPATGRLGRLAAYCGYNRGADGVLME